MTERRPVLLTVSGAIPVDLERDVAVGRRPRADFAMMSDTFDADLVDTPMALTATGRFGAVIQRFVGTGALLAWYCFRHRNDYEVIVTDGEQVGIPLALLGRVLGRGSARHMMIVHILSTPSKRRVIRLGRLAPLIDRFVVYCSRQKQFVVDELGVPAERVTLSTFMVDTSFFDPDRVSTSQEPMICTAGLERRDYATLIAAVEDVDVRVVIAAASPWSTQQNPLGGDRRLPSNVEVRRFDLFELRDLYARSAFVVMPLVDVEFQAGITTMLEAMSMGRAVVCSRTPGQTDTIVDDHTGRYVEPGNPVALRRELEHLLDHPEDARRLGAQARAWAVAEADVETYASRLGELVRQLRAPES